MAIKHGALSTRIFLDRFDLTGDMNEVTWSAERPVADVSTFGNQARNYVPGQHSWNCQIRGFFNSQGSVSAAGSTQPDGTAGAELALYYLENLGTAPAVANKVVGIFQEGIGTAEHGKAGVGAFTGYTATGNLGGGIGLTTSFSGTSPICPVTVLWGQEVNALGTGIGIDLGTPSSAQNGCYCFFWLVGTVFGEGTAQVVGSVSVSDTLGGAYTDIATFAGTAASAKAIIGTVTSGSVPRYARAAYRTSAAGNDAAAGTAAGTLVVAIGRIPPL